jgi:hypothetical protein
MHLRPLPPAHHPPIKHKNKPKKPLQKKRSGQSPTVRSSKNDTNKKKTKGRNASLLLHKLCSQTICIWNSRGYKKLYSEENKMVCTQTLSNKMQVKPHMKL